MEDLFAPVLFMLMVGGVSGYFVGQLVKRARGMALTIGVVVVTIIILVYAGTFNLNLDAINASLANFAGVLATLGIIALVSSVPFVASFIAGLFVGFRRD